MKKGLVVKNTGSWYVVRTNEGQDIECKLKGNFRIKGIRSTNPIAVGDRVGVIIDNEEVGLIGKIEERKNYIIRRSSNLSKESHIIAANIDLCFLIVTVSKPTTSTTFIDRFLASAEAYRVPVNLIFNKVDIYTPDESEYMNALMAMYEYIGYPSMQVSALGNEGLDILQKKIENKITLFSGHSGVGKSTLINALIPGVQMKTGDVSDHHGKGKHTTTFSEMLELPQGGFIIDTPGIKGFGAIDMGKEEIYHYFPDLFKFAADCRFNNCIHLNEPNCAVRQAVEEHYISESRYKSYLSMMDEQDEEKYRK